MNILKIKDKKKRQIVKKYETFKYVFKLIKNNSQLNYLIRYNLTQITSENNLPKNSSAIRLKQRCLFTNKKTIINKYFKLSRQIFLKYARFNNIFGLKKAYW